MPLVSTEMAVPDSTVGTARLETLGKGQLDAGQPGTAAVNDTHLFTVVSSLA